jgi:DNA-binding NarL/FixJ family response regulator
MTSGIEGDGDQPISVVVIEDNRLLRQGLVTLLRKQPDITVLAAPASVGTALKKVRDARPSVVLLDCGLVGHDSVDLTARLHHEVPETRIVGMDLLPLQEDIRGLMRAGASGFIMKNAPIGDLLATIRLVARGVEVVPPQLMLSVVSRIALEAAQGGTPRVVEAVRLTRSELQVMALAGEGRSSAEIASRLHMSLRAVKSNMQNLLEKLVLRTRLEEGVDIAPLRRRRGLIPWS